MEPNQDDPGKPSEVIPPTAPHGTKEIQATLILEKYAKVFCALLKSDSQFRNTEELIVPETGSVPVQVPKRSWRIKRNRTPATIRAVKRCWSIGDLFDARADGPQALLVATDGTPYYLFSKVNQGFSYVEVTREVLLKQSGSVLIFTIGTLDDKLKELTEAHPKSA